MSFDVSEISDAQCEAGIIATAIKHPEFVLNVAYLKPNHFYNIENGCLYWCIEKLVCSGIEHIDAFNLSSAFNSNAAIKKKLQEYNLTNINEYIELSQYAARDSVEEYKFLVNEVITLAFKRELHSTAISIQNSCFDKDNDLNKLNELVNDKITSLSTKFIVGGESVLFGDKVRGLWDEIQSERNSDGTYGIPSNISVFNEYFTFAPGELILLTARMKTGKSIIFTSEAIHKAVYNNIPTLYIDTEISDKLWTKRVLSCISGVPFKKIESGTYDEQEALQIEKALERLEKAPLVHEYVPDGFNATKIEALCRHWQIKMGLQFVIYDYMKYDDAAGASEVSNVLGKMCDFLKNKIAGKMNLAVFSGAQLNRANEVSSSDKIEMYCSTSIRWRKKTIEEVANDGYECGNYCAEIPINRNGKQTDDGEYLDMRLDGEHMRVSAALTRHKNNDNPFS